MSRLFESLRWNRPLVQRTRRRRRTLRQLIIESLDQRLPLAFAITSSGTSITLTGDAADDAANISVSPSGHFRHDLPLSGNLVSNIDTNGSLAGEQALLAAAVTSITIYGNAGNDTIDASAWTGAGLVVYGGAGNDTLKGGAGNDDLRGEGGDDIVEGNGGNDMLYGDGNGNGASTGNDILRGGDGNDILYGDDRSNGGTGNDVLEGGNGNDDLQGHGGNDQFSVWNSTFTNVSGGTGYDRLFFVGSNINLDLVANNKVSGIEAWDITGSGNNSITINQARVLSISDTDIMIVDGNVGDTVNKGSGWTLSGIEGINGSFYRNYSQGSARLKLTYDIALSSTSILENLPPNTVVGDLSTIDLETGNTYAYALVSGVGDADNGAFNVSGSTLRANNSFDFETKSSYTIRVRTTDQGGLSTERAFTITVTDVNGTPTDISLSSNSIVENAGANATVGSLSTTDPDVGDTFTYSLVAGSGDADNAAFNISGSTLRATNSFDFETKSSYSIRIRSTDQESLFTYFLDSNKSSLLRIVEKS